MIKQYATAVVLAVIIVLGGLFLFLTPAPNTVPADGLGLGDGPGLIDPSQSGQPEYYQSSADDIQVTLPFPGAVTGKDFSVRGKARGYWFFEASFPVFLFDPEGNQIAVGLAAPEPPGTEWMTTEFVNFKADVVVPPEFIGPAILVVARDNASGLPEHDAHVSFPITVEY